MDARENVIHHFLGKMVHVEIDRPIGYQHKDITYPVNYGYIPDVIAGDGEAQDVYVLGVSEPLSSFNGQVIGVIRRLNDCEDKLVVAPKGTVFHQGEIAAAVHFQEKYFNSTIVSIFRKSCGVIPFRHNGNNVEFLILFQHVSQTWSFPKGHMEMGETETETALRELLEETGLQATLVPGASTTVEYSVSPLVQKQVVFFLGEVHGTVSLQEREIESYRWVEATELFNYLHIETLTACSSLIKLA